MQRSGGRASAPRRVCFCKTRRVDAPGHAEEKRLHAVKPAVDCENLPATLSVVQAGKRLLVPPVQSAAGRRAAAGLLPTRASQLRAEHQLAEFSPD